MPEFGKLRLVELREIWSHEASGFTPWLAANLPALGDALGMELELVDSEADCGDFSLDVLARDLGTGRYVVIENQLTLTNHDHLGKLLTYAAGFDASAAIWIAHSIRDEHRQALEWLNQHTDTDTHFFAVTVEVLQIDTSRPAYHFKPVVFPNEWQKQTPRGGGKAPSNRAEAYRQFFQTLIDELRGQYRFTGARLAQPQNWYAFASGMSGVIYGASFALGGRVRVDLYLNRTDTHENKALFDSLLRQRQEIEAAFGEPLEWERLNDKRASRIASYFEGSIDAEPEKLALIRQDLITRLLCLKKTFGPVLSTIPKSDLGSPVVI